MSNILFKNANLIYGEEEFTVHPGEDLLVRDGKIISFGKIENPPSDVEVMDLHGTYVMPGLINLHVHLPGSGKPVSVGKIPDAKSGLLHFVLQRMVQKSLITQVNSGVTTVRSVGELYWTDLENREFMKSGKFVGPRLLVSGVGVSVPEGHMAGTMGAICTTPEEARAQVRLAADKGVDWIKIFVSGGVLDASDTGEPARLRMPLELAQAACEEAHQRGLRVASHAEGADSVRVSLQAGVDTIEHGAPMDEGIKELYKKNHSALITTISPALSIALLPGSETGMNEAQIGSAKIVMDGIIESSKQALAAGIPVGLGTDSSCPYTTQYDMWREIYYFAKYCGVTNEFALRTATKKNAEILELQHVTGQIKEGLDADLLFLKENPIEDLEALRTPKMVMTRGMLLRKPRVKHMPQVDEALDKVM